MTPRRYVLPAAALLALAVPAAAAAQAPPPEVTLETAGTQGFEGGSVALAGKRVSAVARVVNTAPESRLTLTFVQGGDTIATANATVTGNGEVTDSALVRNAGVLTLRARVTTPGGGSSSVSATRTARVNVLRPASFTGNRGQHVRWLQRRLAGLGYAIRFTGRHDAHTNSAVIAYRKVLRMARVGNASRAVFYAAAAGRGTFRARFPAAGRHVEADLTRQVFALVERGGKVFRVYHTSSGRPRFKTPTGVHRFWRKEPGLNSRAMLHTVYFTHDKFSKPTRPACGIHGYFAVPTFPNSHCCLRVALSDALFIHRWIRLGERIYVYR